MPDLTTRGTGLLLEAMDAGGVERLACMTMIGAGDSKGHGRAVFDKLIQPVMPGRITEGRNR